MEKCPLCEEREFEPADGETCCAECSTPLPQSIQGLVEEIFTRAQEDIFYDAYQYGDWGKYHAIDQLQVAIVALRRLVRGEVG